MYRSLPLRVWVPALLAGAIAVISFPVGGSGGEHAGAQLRPCTYLDPFIPLVQGRYLLCHGSSSNPYGIDDLGAYRTLLGTRSERIALWAVWEAHAHPLYRLDVLAARMGAMLPLIPISLALEPMLRREAVKGYPAERSGGLAGLMVLQRGGWAFSLWRRLVVRRRENRTLIACSFRLDRLALAVAGRGTGRGVSLLDVEGELELGGSTVLRTGYRLDSDEIRLGLTCRRKGILVSAIWRHHPVLGRTVTLGVGYVWER